MILSTSRELHARRVKLLDNFIQGLRKGDGRSEEEIERELRFVGLRREDEEEMERREREKNEVFGQLRKDQLNGAMQMGRKKSDGSEKEDWAEGMFDASMRPSQPPC